MHNAICDDQVVASKGWPSADGRSFSRDDLDLARVAYRLGVCFPASLYRVMPIILPFVIRDNQCRPRGSARPDEWAWPDRSGYLRDDNSLLKTLINYRQPLLRVSALVESPLAGHGLASSWTCSHIWPNPHPFLNSFVPNLVWLPSTVARLSDLDDHQATTSANDLLRCISAATFRADSVHPAVEEFASRSWNLIDTEFPDVQEISGVMPMEATFEIDKSWFEARLREVRQVADVLEAHSEGREPAVENLRRAFGRFAAHLSGVTREDAAHLASDLTRYWEAVCIAVDDDPPWR